MSAPTITRAEIAKLRDLLDGGPPQPFTRQSEVALDANGVYVGTFSGRMHAELFVLVVNALPALLAIAERYPHEVEQRCANASCGAVISPGEGYSGGAPGEVVCSRDCYVAMREERPARAKEGA